MRIGSVMIDIAGLKLTSEECEQLSNPVVGGVILFSRNYQDPSQLRNLVASIRSVRDPLLIAVDQEGGRVQRFCNNFTCLPPQADLGALYKKDEAAAVEQARELGFTMASEIRAVGIDISLAPVLDIDRGKNTVIGNRSLFQQASGVVALARAYIQGMRAAGMVATGKHFPGHGEYQLILTLLCLKMSGILIVFIKKTCSPFVS